MAAASRRRHIDISAHLTPDELALLAEGKAGEAAEKFRSHLAHCKSCFEAYQEAVEFHARALAGKEPHAPPELVQNGRNVPVRRGKKKGVTRAPRWRMILATAGGLVTLAAVWIFLGAGAQSRDDFHTDCRRCGGVPKFECAGVGAGIDVPRSIGGNERANVKRSDNFAFGACAGGGGAPGAS